MIGRTVSLEIAQTAVIAKLNGCKPQFAQNGFGDCVLCTCPDNLHGVQPGCAVITRESAARYRDDAPRSLTPADAAVIGEQVKPRGKALERAAERWGKATLYKCNP